MDSMTRNLRELLRLADKLDRVGLHAEAAEIDEFANEYSSERIPNPAFSALFKEITSILEDNGVDPGVIAKVVSLQEDKYTVPANEDKYVPEGVTPYFVPRDAMASALNFAEMYRSVRDIEKALKESADQMDEEMRVSLQKDLEEDSASLRELSQTMQKYHTENPKLYAKLMEYVNNALRGDPDSVRLYSDRRQAE